MNSSEPGNVPPSIRKFIFRYIDSAEQIAIILLLRKDPARQWQMEELIAELRSSPFGVKTRLNELYARGVLCKNVESNNYSYMPCTEEIKDQIDQVAKYNQTHPYKIMELIYTRGDQAVREFANAFKFKKDN